jgi:hypothetical protein
MLQAGARNPQQLALAADRNRAVIAIDEPGRSGALIFRQCPENKGFSPSHIAALTDPPRQLMREAMGKASRSLAMPRGTSASRCSA